MGSHVHASQVCSAPSCFHHLSGWIILSKPFLSPGDLQNTRHRASKAVVVSQVNTTRVRDELNSKEPDATSFLINPEETLWKGDNYKKNRLLWGACLPAFLNFQAVCKTVSKVCKTSFFYWIFLPAQDQNYLISTLKYPWIGCSISLHVSLCSMPQPLLFSWDSRIQSWVTDWRLHFLLWLRWCFKIEICFKIGWFFCRIVLLVPFPFLLNEHLLYLWNLNSTLIEMSPLLSKFKACISNPKPLKSLTNLALG